MPTQLITFGTPYKPETEQSVYNTKLVLQAVAQRFPYWAHEAKPYVNVLTLRAWNRRGYRVKRGEKAIKVMTQIPVRKFDEEANSEIVVGKRKCLAYVFALPQVEPFRNSNTNVPAPSIVSGSAVPVSMIPSLAPCTSGIYGTGTASLIA
jgi:hypothetical protein